MFGVVSRNFVVARHPFRKRVSGCIQSMSLCHQNHFFVFRNEHAQTTNLGPKLMFGVVSRNFVAARHPFRKRESGCTRSTSFRQRNHFFVFCNEHAESTTLGPKLMFGVVLRNFVAARHPFLKWLSGCTRSTSFGHRNHFFVSCNEHAQSTTLGPKLMFVVVSRNFVAARHPFRKWVSGCIQSMSFCHRNHIFVFRKEHAQTTTLGPKLMFVWFHAISLPHVTHSENGCRGCIQSMSFCHRNHFFVFRNEHAQTTNFRSKTHVWVGFSQFRCHTSPVPKTGVGVHTKHAFLPPEPFLRFSQQHAQSTTLGPKLLFGVVLRNFVAARHPFQKWVSGCIQTRVFATGTISSFFTTNMPNPLL
jgi:hypothetical protein